MCLGHERIITAHISGRRRFIPEMFFAKEDAHVLIITRSSALYAHDILRASARVCVCMCSCEVMHSEFVHCTVCSYFQGWQRTSSVDLLWMP